MRQNKSMFLSVLLMAAFAAFWNGLSVEVAAQGPATVKLSLDRTNYRGGEKIDVSYSGVTAEMKNARAWIGIAQQNAEPNKYGAYKYAEQDTGNLQLVAPWAAGTYEVRFYKGSSANEANLVKDASVTFTVVPPEVKLSLSKTNYTVAEGIDISFSGVTAEMEAAKAWIAIAKQDSTRNRDIDYTDHFGTQELKQGSGNIQLLSPLEAGTYEVRFFQDGNESSLLKEVTVPFTMNGENTPAVKLSLNKTTYNGGETINVNYSGVTARMKHERAQITIAKQGAPANSYRVSKDVEQGSGQVQLEAPQEDGTYEIRFYQNGNSANYFVKGASVTFTLVGGDASAVRMSLNKTDFAPGEKIEVSYSGVSARLEKEKAEIRTTEKGGGRGYVYQGSGKVQIVAPEIYGAYEMRFYQSWSALTGTAVESISIPFNVVREDTSAVKLSINKTHYVLGEKIIIDYSGITAGMKNAQAWITTAERDAAPNRYGKRENVREGSGKMQLDCPTKDGAYEVRLYLGRDANEENLAKSVSVPFTVGNEGASAVKLSLNKTNYAAGEKIEVSYSGVTAEMKDAGAWIGIAKQGAASGAYMDWKYVSQGSGSIQLDAPLEDGTYEVRFYRGSSANDENLVKGASVTFTIGGGDALPIEIKLENNTYHPLTQMVCTVSGITEQMVKERAHVVIYPKGNDRNYGSWSRVKAGTSQVTLDVPGSGGEYEVRLYRGPDSYKKEDLVATVPFKVENNPFFNEWIKLEENYYQFTKIAFTVSGITEQMNKDSAFVAIYKKDANHLDVGARSRVNTGARQITFDNPGVGEYEMRLYRKDKPDGNQDLVTAVPFMVKENSAFQWMQLEKNSYQPNTKLVVTVTGITEQMEKDRATVAFAERGAEHSSNVPRHPVKAGTSQVVFDIPGAYEYEIRLYDRDSCRAENFVTAVPFTAKHSSSFDDWIKLEQNTFEPFTQNAITVSGITDVMVQENAYVAIYKKGAPHRVFSSRSTVKAGTNQVPMTMPSPGEYEMRLYCRELFRDKDLVTAIPFTVETTSSSNEWIQLPGTALEPFTHVDFMVSGITEQMVKEKAYVAIYKIDANHRNYETQSFVKAGTNLTTLVLPGNGKYEMRLYSRDKSYKDEDLVATIPFVVGKVAIASTEGAGEKASQFAEKPVCEVVRDGVVVGSYATLAEALAVEGTPSQPVAWDDGNESSRGYVFTQIQRGDTIRLLTDINHTTGIIIGIGDSKYSRLGELTIDLNGHKLNVSNTNVYALYLNHTFLTVIHDKPGSEFNISYIQTPDVTDRHDAYSAVRVVSGYVASARSRSRYNRDESLTHVGVSYITNVTATGVKNVVGVETECSDPAGLINVAGNITVSGTEYAYGASIEGDTTLNIGGNVTANSPAEPGYRKGGTGINVGSRKKDAVIYVNVGGSIHAKNGYGIFGYNGGSAETLKTQLTVKGDVVSALGVKSACQLVEIFGNVISRNTISRSDREAYGVSATKGSERFIVHGNVETYSPNEYAVAVQGDSGIITVHGNVICDYTGVSGSSSTIRICGDVTSRKGNAVVAQSVGVRTWNEEEQDNEMIFDENHFIHIGGNVISENNAVGIVADLGARVIVDGKLITSIKPQPKPEKENEPEMELPPEVPAWVRLMMRNQMQASQTSDEDKNKGPVGGGYYGDKKAEIVSQPARFGYITYQVSPGEHDPPNAHGYVWVRDQEAPLSAFVGTPATINGTSPDAKYFAESDRIEITVEGSPGGAASAIIGYLTLDGEEVKKAIPLMEVPGPGKNSLSLYKGSFIVENMREITGITCAVNVKDMEPGTASALKLPEIRGAIRVRIHNPYLEQFPGTTLSGTLTAISPSGGGKLNVTLSEDESFMVRGLPADGEYTLTMNGLGNGHSGHDMLGTVKDISVETGRATEVGFTPSGYTAQISVQLFNEAGGEQWARLFNYDAPSGEALGFVEYGPRRGPLRHTTVKVMDAASGQKITDMSCMDNGKTETLLYGKALSYPVGTVLDILLPGADSHQPMRKRVTVAPSGNDFRLEWKDVGRESVLTGRVTLDGKPVKDAQVFVYQDKAAAENLSYVFRNALGRIRFEFSGKTDVNGFYRIPICPGFDTMACAQIGSGESVTHGSKVTPQVNLAADEEVVMDFEMAKAIPVKPQIPIFTQYLGDNVPVELPFHRDVYYYLNFSLFNHRTQRGQTFSHLAAGSNFFVVEGDILTVMAGDNGGLPYTEFPAIAAADGSIITDVLLKQNGALVSMNLCAGEESNIKVMSVSVTDMHTGDWLYPGVKYEFLKFDEKAGGEHRLWIYKPGTYKIALFYSNDEQYIKDFKVYKAERIFSVVEGQMLDFGDIPMISVYDDSAEPIYEVQGQLTVASAVYSPGDVVDLKAVYVLTEHGKNNSMTLQIPKGTAYLPGSLSWKSEKLPDPEIDDHGFFTVQFPDIEYGNDEALTGSMNYQVQIDEDTTELMIFAAASCRSVYLGTAMIEVNNFRMKVPDYTLKRDLLVTGLAPAGSEITIYDRGNVLVGKTTVPASGNWTCRLDLPGKDGVKRLYELHAETVLSDVKRTTRRETVVYDPDRPMMTKLYISTGVSRYKVFDVTDGPISTPHVMQGLIPVAAEFSGDVEDVVFTLVDGDKIDTAPGTYNPETGLIQAELRQDIGDEVPARYVPASTGVHQGLLPTGGGRSPVGKLSVDYTPKQKFDPKTLSHKYTDEELRNQLPSEFSDFEIISVKENTLPDGTYTLKAEVRLMKDGVIMTIDLSVKEVNLPDRPMNAEEMAVYAETGVPAYNSSSVFIERENGGFDYKLRTTIPTDYINSQMGADSAGISGGHSMIMLLSAIAGGMPLGVTSQLAVAGKTGWHLAADVGTTASTGVSIADTQRQRKQINFLKHNCISPKGEGWDQWVGKGRDVEWAEWVREKNDLEWAERQLDRKDLINTASTVVGVLMIFAPIPGARGIALGILVSVAFNAASSGPNAKAEKVIQAITEKCRRRGAYPPDASLHWITDPSGLVYEVVPEEPLAGVTTTVLQMQNGMWRIWDAEPYEQENPLITGPDGLYAWDVPEGLWKVMYEKEGYKTVFSEEMEVPPIRTDVNVGMESVLPASVSEAYIHGGGIAIVFDKYVLVSDVHKYTMSVSARDAEDSLRGDFTPAKPVEYKGEAVAKRFIFMPEGEMESTDYVVSVLPAIRSYAGVPMGSAGNGAAGSGARHVVPVSVKEGQPEAVTKPVKQDCGCR